MTNPNNGATLEDCHSNFFDLTDLCGIKWRRLVSDGAVGPPGHPHHLYGPLEDPVLHSYSKCLAANILCVWRISPNSKSTTPSTPQPDQFAAPGQTQQHFFHPPGQNTSSAPNQSYMQSNIVPQNMGPMGLGSGQVMMSSSFPQVSTHHGSPFPPSLQSTISGASLNGPKELWLFWYGEDPDLTNLVNSQLLKSEGEQGSWEGGLSYECRTLLFKALHNLIERCLLSRDFVRLGKWFIQPCDDNQRTLRNFPMQLSFCFSFFLHGDSTVCMSVDVRQHPVVRRVSKQHLTANQSQPLNSPVILAPYGLAGTLTGIVHRVSEPATNKILEEWKHFYPIDTALKGPAYEMTLPNPPHSSSPSTNTKSSPSAPAPSCIPPILEVVVGGLGGVRMRYPACYVLVTEMDEISKVSDLVSKRAATQNSGNVKSKVSNEDNLLLSTKDQKHLPSHAVSKVDGVLSERVWQESILCSKGNGENIPPSSNANVSCSEPNNYWEFVDPTKRSLCSCSRCKRLPGSRTGSGHGSSSMISQSSKSTKIRRNTFHKRNLNLLTKVDTLSSLWDNDESARNPQLSINHKSADSQKGSHITSNIRLLGAPGTPIGGPPSYKGGPVTTPLGSEGPGPSPASIAPATPRSQLPGISQQDTPAPTVHSPQSGNDNHPNMSSDSAGQKPTGSGQVYSPITVVNSFEGAKTESIEANSTNEQPSNIQQRSDVQNSVAMPGVTNTTQNGCQSLQYERITLKRPSLPSNHYEPLLEDEVQDQPSDIIFDYDTIENWLSHPFKRRKAEEEVESSKLRKSMYNWGFGMMKLPEDTRAYLQNGRVDRTLGPSDPYEFDDENHVPPSVNMGGLKRKDGIKEEERSPQCISETINDSNSLFTSDGLRPSYSDLDKIFDNSDTSSDETFQAPTPPGSNKPAGFTEEMTNGTSASTKQKQGLGILRPEELSKMFPTPPSHEHNPIASPCGILPETTIVDGINDTTYSKRQPESYSSLYSPPDEPPEVRKDSANFWKVGPQHQSRLCSQDWSYVYKVPVVYKMVGSTKYTPLPVLPSQNLVPLAQIQNCAYKPSWETHSSSSTQQQQKHQTMPPPTSNNNTNQPQQHPSHFLGPPVPPPPLRPGLSPISPAANSMRGQPFDMGSPPSSVYLKQAAHGPVVAQGSHSQAIHPPHSHYGRGLEAHALVVNLSLADSVINLFRDHNFDSCTMCVCNAGNRVVGNIKGSEAGIYIPDPNPEDPVRCSCGFSSSVNRRLAHRAGLFYEDEFEITTAALAPLVLLNDEWYERKKQPFLLLDPKYSNMAALLADKDAISSSAILDTVPPYLLELLREQCLALQGKGSVSRYTGNVDHHRWNDKNNYLEYLDGNRAALVALEHGRTLMLEASGRSGFSRLPEETLPLKPNFVFMHKWGYLWARGPKSNQDIMNVMKALLPLLQTVVHNVYGPLTWRQIHRLAGRGTDDLCEPQPIPSVLVSSEKDFLALSPLSTKFWEKLLLEPYSYPRDVAYLVVAPDNEFVLQKTRTYFRELSTMYEVSQLGRHCPITKVLRDGILRVSSTAADKLANEHMDEWFTVLPDIPISPALRLYAQVCRYYLAPQLAQISLDQSLLDPPNVVLTPNRSGISDRPAPSPKMPPPSVEGSCMQGPPTPKNEPDTDCATSKENHNQDLEEDERDPPAIVIYLVEPFGYGSDNKEVHRMATLGLLRCFSAMLGYIPEAIKNNITLQIVSLEDILSLGNSTMESKFRNDQMRAMSLTVYSQCRRLLIHQNTVRSLTGFGPAASAELFMKSKDDKKKNAYKLYTPSFILAPVKERISEGTEWLGGMPSVGGMVSSGNSSSGPLVPTSSSVLYVAYCISEDQRWLLASATDDRGEIMETTTISIYVPNRSRRRKASARKHGLQKLMDFILGIMSIGVQPWRLVVGRVGRIGHGELESWSTLLSRKSLVRASNQLKDACRQCSFQYPSDTPSVLSACLVSLEPDSCLRLMPDQFTPDERFGSSGSTSSLSTPQDVSCTHILVFPTSATTQSSQTAFQEQHINDSDVNDDFIFNTNDDIIDGIDGMNDLQLNDIFSWDDNPIVSSPVGSPRRDSSSQPGSPGMNVSGRQSPFQGGGQARAGARTESSDELGTLLQQPLALGYIVSTSDSGQLPSWFWASCPQRAAEKGSGVFLKSALHLHSHSALHNLDDILPQQSNVKQHPLDSQYTTDVLRFVLEGYNALSWLCLDPITHDRKSCLPVHIQKLMQLYFTISELV